MRSEYTRALCALLLFTVSHPASAALLYRMAGQAYYDDVLDITWLRNANLAASNTFGLSYNTDLGDHPFDYWVGPSYTEQILPDGRMNFGAALHWIDAMNADGGTGYLGYDDWRLPGMYDVLDDIWWNRCTVAPEDYGESWNNTSCGYNVPTGSAGTGIYSEMASLWYDTLGNLALYDTSGNAPQPGWGLTNTGPFQNLQAGAYTYSTEHYPILFDEVWYLNTNDGLQSVYGRNGFTYAWAVRSGDVADVPVPPAVWLFASGLIGLTGLSRRKNV